MVIKEKKDFLKIASTKSKEKFLEEFNEFFKKNDWEITEDVAVCLYTAIMTDTGNFRFENTSPNAVPPWASRSCPDRGNGFFRQ